MISDGFEAPNAITKALHDQSWSGATDRIMKNKEIKQALDKMYEEWIAKLQKLQAQSSKDEGSA